jgi:RNA polymerase sigma-70 factor (ECF subfamily)
MDLDAKLSLDVLEIGLRRIPYAQLVLMSDDALMLELKDGNGGALAVLFDRYHRLVMKVATRILRDTGEAEDLTQSVFLEIFRSASQFNRAKGTAKVWVLQYAYHRSFSRRQYLNLRGICVNTNEGISTRKESAIGHSSALHALESTRAIKQALEHLNKAQRTTLELAFYEGLSMHEIAVRTGESFDSVRHQYYRGLDKLRSMFCGASDANLKSTSPDEPIPYVRS